MASRNFRLRPTVILAARGAALALAVAAMGATEGEGQGLKGRLKRAAEQKAVQETGQALGGQPVGKGGAVRFDSVIVELDQTRLDQVMVSLAAGRRVLDGVDGGPGVAALAARREEATNRRVALHEKHASEIQAFERSTVRIRDCRNERLDEIRNALEASYQRRIMTDPALQQKMLEYAQRLAAAQAAGDTALMLKLNREVQASGEVAPTPADSARVDASCGKLPKALAVMSTIDSLDGAERRYAEEVRETEERAAAAEQAAAGGMSARQLAMARERIEMYLGLGPRPNGFSATELEALGARRGDLQKLL